jgi:hypothetical protein
MKRLNDNELTHRIHHFMERKMQEFPELQGEGSSGGTASHTQETRPVQGIFQSANRINLRWRLSHNT